MPGSSPPNSAGANGAGPSTGGGDPQANTAVFTIGNRCVNPELLDEDPSNYSLYRAYVQNDANNLRGSFRGTDNVRQTVNGGSLLAGDRHLPPVPKRNAEGGVTVLAYSGRIRDCECRGVTIRAC